MDANATTEFKSEGTNDMAGTEKIAMNATEENVDQADFVFEEASEPVLDTTLWIGEEVRNISIAAGVAGLLIGAGLTWFMARK